MPSPFQAELKVSASAGYSDLLGADDAILHRIIRHGHSAIRAASPAWEVVLPASPPSCYLSIARAQDALGDSDAAE
jgi:hypothetical protein